MVLQNLVQGRLVNGSLGQIVGFSTAADALRQHIQIANLDSAAPPPPGLKSSGQSWPLVRFIAGDEVLMIPQEFTINNADGVMEARRDQVRSEPGVLE